MRSDVDLYVFKLGKFATHTRSRTAQTDTHRKLHYNHKPVTVNIQHYKLCALFTTHEPGYTTAWITEDPSRPLDHCFPVTVVRQAEGTKSQGP